MNMCIQAHTHMHACAHTQTDRQHTDRQTDTHTHTNKHTQTNTHTHVSPPQTMAFTHLTVNDKTFEGDFHDLLSSLIM